jgi:hypothetical protein
MRNNGSFSGVLTFPRRFLQFPRNRLLIQSVSGGKANILGGHSNGHSKQKKKIHMYVCRIPNGFRDRAISQYSYKIVDEKEILCTISNTGIYCSSDTVGTVYLV